MLSAWQGSNGGGNPGHDNDIEAKVHETSARNDALLSAVSRIISFLVPFGLDSEDIGTVLMEKDNHNEDDDLTF